MRATDEPEIGHCQIAGKPPADWLAEGSGGGFRHFVRGLKIDEWPLLSRWH
jgi:hypothetical protein